MVVAIMSVILKIVIRTSKTCKYPRLILLMRGGYGKIESEDKCLANGVEDNQILCFSFAFGYGCLFMVGLGVVNECWIV